MREPGAFPPPADEPPEWVRRLRGFHGDSSGQILPIIFTFSLAFFTGVVLLINTGQNVNQRIEVQNAVDAGAVSGVNSLARGMNYLARNNVQQAKTLASIAIIRAFPNAIKAAEATLKVWRGVVTGLRAAAAAVAPVVPFGPAAAAALNATAFAIEIKVQQEEAVLKAVKSATEALDNIWSKDENKLGWRITKALAKLGDVLAYGAPIIAQFNAKLVFLKNVPGGEASIGGMLNGLTFQGPDMWLIPFYPNLPICKGKFGDLLEPTTFYAERYSKPIIILGWIVLTLSLFPVWYEQSVGMELRRIFTGESPSEIDTSGAHSEEQAEMEQLQKDNDKLLDEANKLDAERKDLENNVIPALIDKRDAEEPNSNAWKDYDDQIKEKQKRVDQIKDRLDEIDKEVEDNNNRIEEIQQKIAPTSGDPPQPAEGTPPDDAGASFGDVTGGQGAQDRNDIYPYVIDGTDWPNAYTYVGIAWKPTRTPYLEKFYQRHVPVGVVYAAAQLFNPTRADLWTPDWRAKLVRAEAGALYGNGRPLGTTVKSCGGQSTGNGGPSNNGMGGIAPSSETATEQTGFLDELFNTLGKH